MNRESRDDLDDDVTKVQRDTKRKRFVVISWAFTVCVVVRHVKRVKVLWLKAAQTTGLRERQRRHARKRCSRHLIALTRLYVHDRLEIHRSLQLREHFNLSTKPRTRTRIEACRSLHVATAPVVSFLGEPAVELPVFHLTAAFVHRLARYAALHLLFGAKCCRRQDRQDYACS